MRFSAARFASRAGWVSVDMIASFRVFRISAGIRVLEIDACAPGLSEFTTSTLRRQTCHFTPPARPCDGQKPNRSGSRHFCRHGCRFLPHSNVIVI